MIIVIVRVWLVSLTCTVYITARPTGKAEFWGTCAEGHNSNLMIETAST